MKTCTRCNKPYPDELFIGAKGGQVKNCAYCGEKLKEIQRRYREKNREKAKERSRRYHKENREKIKESKRRYREANLEKETERSRRYHKENREKAKERNLRHREERRKHQANCDMEALFPGMLATQITNGETQ